MIRPTIESLNDFLLSLNLAHLKEKRRSLLEIIRLESPVGDHEMTFLRMMFSQRDSLAQAIQ